MRGFPLRGYYAILDVRAPAPAGAFSSASVAHEVRRAEALLAARPCCLQLRGKDLDDAALVALGRALGPLCQRAGVPFCVNDRADLAFLVGAAVVHVGQDDLSLADVRKVQAALGRVTAVGVSTHNEAQARAAIAAGADYIGFGPIFATSSKRNPDPVVGTAALATVAALGRAAGVPVVAIGGLSRARIADVIAAGADAAAVIGDIDQAPSPEAAAREIAAAFA